MAAMVVCPLDARSLVAPLLPSLPGAAIASEPASAVLPLLSPILRQRVQFLSASSSEPWIRLLSYDPAKAAKLIEVARSARLEPHPVSGEIEIDWDSAHTGVGGGDVEIRYRRLDVETLQALVLLSELDLVFRLVYCESDQEGGGSGWRIGEVSIPDRPDAFLVFGGCQSVAEAERLFTEEAAAARQNGVHNNHVADGIDGDDDDDDDDSYWARYDATPARTPAVKRSPAPGSAYATNGVSAHHNDEAEDAYFAQYDSVQPAMDNHDPDEEVHEPAATAAFHPSLGGGAAQVLERAVNGANGANGTHVANGTNGTNGTGGVFDYGRDADDQERLANLIHPRPASASSNNSSTSSAVVAKLEHSAGKKEQSEFGVKQHVSRSIKSLYMLARASGIDREEFAQLVKTELDVLAMMDE